MASLYYGDASCLYNIILCKSRGKTRLVQYVIKAKNLFKTNIYTLEVMLSNFKKHCTTRFLSADLTALRPAIRPTGHSRMGPVFSHNAGDSCLIINM